jgi:hypothetical protein
MLAVIADISPHQVPAVVDQPSESRRMLRENAGASHIRLSDAASPLDVRTDQFAWVNKPRGRQCERQMAAHVRPRGNGTDQSGYRDLDYRTRSELEVNDGDAMGAKYRYDAIQLWSGGRSKRRAAQAIPGSHDHLPMSASMRVAHSGGSETSK